MRDSYIQSFEGDVQWLRRDWEELISALPLRVRAAGTQLRDRLYLKEGGAGKGWLAQFTPLVLLYPQLQCEGLLDVGRDRWRQANLAHVCFLIHSFVDDRVRDSQIEVDDDERSFVKTLYDHGWSMVESLVGQDTRGHHWLRELESWNDWAQQSTYPRRDCQSRGIKRTSVMSIATGRASFGLLVAKALMGNLEKDVRRAERAFAHIVTGLQWLDDLEDWEEDLLTGDDNLLLWLANRRREPRPFSSDRIRASTIGDMVDPVIQTARFHFVAAIEIQRELCCNRMLWLLEKRIENLERIRHRAAIDLMVQNDTVKTGARLTQNQ